jgi:hypothetical protein
MKTCTKCQTSKPLVEFVKDKRRSDGRGSWCVLCNREYMKGLIKAPKIAATRKATYQANKVALNAASRARWAEKSDEYKVAADKWREENRSALLADYRQRGEAHRAFIDNLKKDKPCIDCGGTFPSYVMEFDHVRGNKRWALGKMSNHRREAVIEEVAKCELVCCACHRVRTQTRKGASKLPKVQAFRAWLSTLKTNPCTDCGKTLPHAAMDFDHIRGEKTTQIADMWSWGREKVLVELSKCELVCANCHRIRTQTRKEMAA